MFTVKYNGHSSDERYMRCHETKNHIYFILFSDSDLDLDIVVDIDVTGQDFEPVRTIWVVSLFDFMHLFSL